MKLEPESAWSHYDIARVYSQKNQTELTIESLQKAFDFDNSTVDSSMADPDFNNIRQTPEYQQLIITTYEQLIDIDPNNINAYLKEI